jgi:hypothetical protein
LRVLTGLILIVLLAAPGITYPAQAKSLSGEQPEGKPLFHNREAGDLAVEVKQNGLTALRYEALKTAGFAVDQLDPHTLALEHAGLAVAMEWEGDEDAVFEAGERFLFYAQPRFSRWTDKDVYFLTRDPALVQRIGARTGDPAGRPAGQKWVERVFEKNLLYTPDCNCGLMPGGRDGDRWVWDILRKPDQTVKSYDFTLPSVSGDQPAQMSLWLIGFTALFEAPDHQVSVSVNGQYAGQAVFDGRQAYELQLSLPAGLLKTGGNTLQLSLPGLPGIEVEGVWLDAFAVRYAQVDLAQGALSFSGEDGAAAVYTVGAADVKVYDISLPDRPERVSGVQFNGLTEWGDPTGELPRQYLVVREADILLPDGMRPAELLTGPEADYIIITPKLFKPAAERLAGLRSRLGYRVAVESIESIYDAWGGQAQPEAIRSYLAQAYSTWQIRPEFVVLMGDGTSDPKQYKASSSVTYIPPFLADVDPLAGETAADNRYVCLEGTDNLPEMAVGRLPVNSLEEANTVVDKIIAYELNPYLGSWRQQVSLVADNADFAGNFATELEAIGSEFVKFPLTAKRLYYTDQNILTFRQQVLNTWQAGSGLMVYSGHSSIHQWSVDRFFHLEDVKGLKNANRQPIVLEMTCLTGAFQVPDLPTLDESLVRSADGGAIAVWGSSGFGLSKGHNYLTKGFMESLLINREKVLGKSIIYAKLYLSQNSSSYSDLVDTFNLLGDPALNIMLYSGNYFPVIQRPN